MLSTWVIKQTIAQVHPQVHLYWWWKPYRHHTAQVPTLVWLMTIQCSSMGATSSLFIHWCWLGLGCVDVPKHPNNYIGKVTTSKCCWLELSNQHSSKFILKCIAIDSGNSSTIILLKLLHLFGKWCSDVAVWVPPVACSFTDVNLYLYVLICLNIWTSITPYWQSLNQQMLLAWVTKPAII